jgi:MFS transporter, putative metabolite transport protein
MLCETKSRLGFLGACFFIGVISASSIVPVGYLSDRFGRKWIFVGTMISEIISCYILLTALSLDMLYAGMFIMGLGHPGRFIVAMSYADEFLTAKQKQILMPLGSITKGLTVIFTAFYFQ